MTGAFSFKELMQLELELELRSCAAAATQTTASRPTAPGRGARCRAQELFACPASPLWLLQGPRPKKRCWHVDGGGVSEISHFKI